MAWVAASAGWSVTGSCRGGGGGGQSRVPAAARVDTKFNFNSTNTSQIQQAQCHAIAHHLFRARRDSECDLGPLKSKGPRGRRSWRLDTDFLHPNPHCELEKRLEFATANLTGSSARTHSLASKTGCPHHASGMGCRNGDWRLRVTSRGLPWLARRQQRWACTIKPYTAFELQRRLTGAPERLEGTGSAKRLYKI